MYRITNNSFAKSKLSHNYIMKMSAGNEIYLYEMLATNLLQAMLVRRAEQSHQQSSNSALPTR